MNRKVIKRCSKRVYITFTSSPPLKSRFHNGGGELPFFPPFLVCGNDAICLHYGDDIISKSSLHPKMQEESQNWATKMIGRTEVRFQVKGLAASKRQRTTEENMLGLHDRRIAFGGRDSKRIVGSFVYWKKVLFGSASSKAVFERDNCRHVCMHAYTRLLLSGTFALDHHPYQTEY